MRLVLVVVWKISLLHSSQRLREGSMSYLDWGLQIRLTYLKLNFRSSRTYLILKKQVTFATCHSSCSCAKTKILNNSPVQSPGILKGTHASKKRPSNKCSIGWSLTFPVSTSSSVLWSSISPSVANHWANLSSQNYKKRIANKEKSKSKSEELKKKWTSANSARLMKIVKLILIEIVKTRLAHVRTLQRGLGPRMMTMKIALKGTNHLMKVWCIREVLSRLVLSQNHKNSSSHLKALPSITRRASTESQSPSPSNLTLGIRLGLKLSVSRRSTRWLNKRGLRSKWVTHLGVSRFHHKS